MGEAFIKKKGKTGVVLTFDNYGQGMVKIPLPQGATYSINGQTGTMASSALVEFTAPLTGWIKMKDGVF